MSRSKSSGSTPDLLSAKVNELIAEITKRIQVMSALQEYIDSQSNQRELVEILRGLEILKKDAQRTVESAESYLTTLKHTGAAAQRDADLLKTIERTINAAQLVLDKRFIEIIQKAKKIDIKYSKMSPEYVKIFNLNGAGAPSTADDDIYFSFSCMVWDVLESTSPADLTCTEQTITWINAQLMTLDNPYRPHFSQIKADSKFSETSHEFTSSAEVLGASVLEMGAQIKAGHAPKERINVSVFYHQGAWVCANNRSLAAASESGIEPRLEVVFPIVEFIKFYDEKRAAIRERSARKKMGGEQDLFAISLELEKQHKDRWPTVQVPLTWLTEPSRLKVSEGPRFFSATYPKVSREPQQLSTEASGSTIGETASIIFETAVVAL